MAGLREAAPGVSPVLSRAALAAWRWPLHHSAALNTSGEGLPQSHSTDGEAEAQACVVSWTRGSAWASPHRVLESHWFVWITQMNHIPKEIGHEKHRDWASSQVGSRGGVPAERQGGADGAATGSGSVPAPSRVPRPLLAAGGHLQRGALHLP